MDTSDDLRPNLYRARSVSQRLRRIFDADGSAIGTLDEALRLCEAGWAAVDDPYCRSVLRAIGVCAEYAFTPDPDSVSLQPLVHSLLCAYDVRLDELERVRPDAGTGRHPERRRSQRRNYLLRPTARAARWPRYRAASQNNE